MGGFNAAPRVFRGDVSANELSTDELNLKSLTSDPPSPTTGDKWYRADIDEFRVQTKNGARSVSATDEPDSVIHQYEADTFVPTGWRDSIGDADMTVNGLTESSVSVSRSVAGDGSSAFGVSSGPETLPGQSSSFGVAFTFVTTDTTGDRFFASADSNNSVLTCATAPTTSGGNIEFEVRDTNKSPLNVRTTAEFSDGSVHLCCINKNTDDANDINIYVDDMNSPASTTVQINQAFNNNDYQNNADMAFFASNSPIGVVRHLDGDIPFFEFNTAPYSQTERVELKSRRPEV